MARKLTLDVELERIAKKYNCNQIIAISNDPGSNCTMVVYSKGWLEVEAIALGTTLGGRLVERPVNIK